MHYWGMQALVVPGELVWNSSLVTASLVLGVTFALAAIAVFDQLAGARAILVAALCLASAVCALHFTAMAAVEILPNPTVEPGVGMNKVHLAIAVVAVTFVVFLCMWVAIVIQRANARLNSLLREQKDLFETAIHHLPVGLSMFDAKQRLVMCNPAYRKLFGLSEADTSAGRTLTQIVLEHVKREHGRSRQSIDGAREWVAEQRQKLSRGNAFSETLELPDGRTILKRVEPIRRGGWVDVQEDVTSMVRANEKLEWLARHDALTGIPNRLQFRERLEHLFATYQPSCPFALHWIDLDRFKDINDQLGHQVGDEYLKCIAKRLTNTLRACDVVGRLGGDEFAILQVGACDESSAVQFAEAPTRQSAGPLRCPRPSLEWQRQRRDRLGTSSRPNAGSGVRQR